MSDRPLQRKPAPDATQDRTAKLRELVVYLLDAGDLALDSAPGEAFGILAEAVSAAEGALWELDSLTMAAAEGRAA
jgi:hypothetical protein